MEQQRFINNSN